MARKVASIGSVAVRVHVVLALAVEQRDVRVRYFAGRRDDLERDELVLLALRRQLLVGGQRVQVLVEHLAFLVGKFLEAGEGMLDRLLAFQFNAELGQAAS